MRLAFAGNGPRGSRCLEALLAAGHEVALVLVHPETSSTSTNLASAVEVAGLRVEAPTDVNNESLLAGLAQLELDVVVLAGYGQIVGDRFIAIPRLGVVNLHAGKLPEYRGSSPLNWALINGEASFTLSVIRIDSGVDTGDVLGEATFAIGLDDTIADLHAIANAEFPKLLLDALAGLSDGSMHPRPQDPALAAYYPLRFPDDGLILWDLISAEEAHNRIRALTDPYPGAFTYHQGRRVRLLRSRRTEHPVYGDPGRVYRISEHGALVCASDRCLWIERASLDGGEDALQAIVRYDRLATARWLAVESMSGGAR